MTATGAHKFSAEAELKRVINQGERILWAGRPDVQAIVKTAHRGKKTPWLYRLISLLLVAWIGYTFWNQSEGGSAFDWKVLLLVGIVAGTTALLMAYRSFGSGKPLIRWATPLSYGITDQRVLILRDGSIENEFSQRDVMQASLMPRKGVPGFSDIVWAQKAAKGSFRHGGAISPLKQEKLQTGFKALAGAERVKRILDTWVQKQSRQTRAQDDNFVKRASSSSASEEKAGVEQQHIADAVRYLSPVYGFSLEFPASWEITSRYRRLAFGKWGLEREAVWSVPDAKPKWNVIRGHNESNTHVEIQVHKTAPINSLEALTQTSKAASFLGTGEVLDHEASITVNGIPGFYVTRKCGNAASILPEQIQQKLSFWQQRQYVLHDGTYQYYIVAMWPADAPAQRGVCEAIIASLKPC